mgnify:CR=1 FL=1
MCPYEDTTMSVSDDLETMEHGTEILALTRDLCDFATGVVVPQNRMFFRRIEQELPIKLYRYPSGLTFNGWLIPQCWWVERATIYKDQEQVFDGKAHTLGVATYSRSFQGRWDRVATV